VAFLGPMVAVSQSLPATVLRINGVDALTLDKAEDGAIAPSLMVTSADNKVIAQMVDGEFKIDPNNSFDTKRPDYHSLKVVDQYGQNVLHMRYMNKNAIAIDAQLKGSPLYGSHTPASAVCVGNPDGTAMVEHIFTDKTMYTKWQFYSGDSPQQQGKENKP
jgi:hypothetical protein